MFTMSSRITQCEQVPVVPAACGDHELQPVRQRFHWDCGVACVLMLLADEQRKHFLEHFDEICAEEGFNRSTWTIDLCYLLKRFEIPHEMYSVMLGVNEEYKRFSFYNRVLEKDRARVLRRFSGAGAAGVSAAEGALGAQRLLRHLTASGPALVLVHASLLRCQLCPGEGFKQRLRRYLGPSYTGHYVLVVGARYLSGEPHVWYVDPARECCPPRPPLCRTTLRQLQRAREAKGTDQDIILVHRIYRMPLLEKELSWVVSTEITAHSTPGEGTDGTDNGDRKANEAAGQADTIDYEKANELIGEVDSSFVVEVPRGRRYTHAACALL